jgi:SAM-dependent methyltransferase
MDPDELRRRIAAFPRWHYEFDFGGGITTPIHEEDRGDRHHQRGRYFFDPFVAVAGGSLRGRRVLDLGCNAGWWSLRAAEAGADFVAGIDGRQMHVDQANLVFEAKGIDPSRYSFGVADVLRDKWPDGPFDVVLCLGLLYHVSDPIGLLDRISETNTDLLVIDTAVADGAGSYWRSRTDSADDPRSAVGAKTVLIPSRRALVDLVKSHGYRVVPLAPNMSSYQGMDDFRTGERLAFICAKLTDLSSLRPAAGPPPFSRFESAMQRWLRTARARIWSRRLTKDAAASTKESGPRT